jgi:hypothetical protein
MVSEPGNPEVAMIPVSARNASLSRETWWDTDGSMDCGAGPLVYRCMREYYWNKDYAVRVLKGYRQFLELKTILEDWDAKILAPSPPVNQMWHQHILDVSNYCHDCLLICGRVVGNDPDGALDEWALEKRMVATKQLLRARFEREIDSDTWNFGDGVAATVASVAGESKGPTAPHEPSNTLLGASMCVSGLTADEKKYDQVFEEKKRFHADLFGHGSPLDFDTRKFRSTATALYDERRDDEAAMVQSRKMKGESVLIHDVKDFPN